MTDSPKPHINFSQQDLLRFEADPRFPLFQHLLEVHAWDAMTAYQFSDAIKGGSPLCPVCDWGKADA